MNAKHIPGIIVDWSDSHTAQLRVDIDPDCLSVTVTGRVAAAHRIARLVAAAPDLLAACEFALAVQVGNNTDDHDDAQRLRDAITKARGET